MLNRNALDSGNAEGLLRYGRDEQKEGWLEPPLAGDICTAFAMTEPGVASSDATNMQLNTVVEGDEQHRRQRAALG